MYLVYNHYFILILLYCSSSDDNKASFILPFTVDVSEDELWSLEDVGKFLHLVASKHEQKGSYNSTVNMIYVF